MFIHNKSCRNMIIFTPYQMSELQKQHSFRCTECHLYSQQRGFYFNYQVNLFIQAATFFVWQRHRAHRINNDSRHFSAQIANISCYTYLVSIFFSNCFYNIDINIYSEASKYSVKSPISICLYPINRSSD